MSTTETHLQDSPSRARDHNLTAEIWGLVLLTLALCLFLALVSFSRVDTHTDGDVVNLIGPVGVQVADVALRSLGLGAFFFNAVLFFSGFALLFGRQVKLSPTEGAGYALALPAGAVFLHLLFDGERVLGHKAGGVLGELGAEIGRSMLGSVGTTICTIAATLLAATMISETNPSTLTKRIVSWFARSVRKLFLWSGRSALTGVRRLGLSASSALRRTKTDNVESENNGEPDEFGLSDEPLVLPGMLTKPVKKRAKRKTKPPAGGNGTSKQNGETAAQVPLDDLPSPLDVLGPKTDKPKKLRKSRKGKRGSHKVPSAEKTADLPSPRIVRRTGQIPAVNADGTPSNRREVAITIAQPLKHKTREPQLGLELHNREVRGFVLPSAALLAAPKVGGVNVDQVALKKDAERLEQALLEFKIKGSVTGITPGPVVTMFEFDPAPGVKLSSITNLANDVARVLKAHAIRIVAPIPGKGVVGIEVPNLKRETVYLREIIQDDKFKRTRASLPMVLGKDIAGEAVVTDLAKMPHLLVAGSTGSGKSVGINCMLTSLLYHCSPEDLRLILVDPKMLELNVYEGIPHLLTPVVTDPLKAANALKWAVDEMERRYRLLSKAKVRNLASYNREVSQLDGKQIAKAGGCPQWVVLDANGMPQRMPMIVVVIDEFADLMMVASKDIEMCVARLAQKARAAGIHLILATQRPSVDVITGLIKANFPTRMSFRVFSRIDSRTILDTQGAEQLLGMGDMLFRPPGRGDLTRVHGAYVDEKEIGKVVEHLKLQGEPDYMDEITLDPQASMEDFEDEPVDENYDLAVELVCRERKASISMVQRKLRVGYNRAARMIEMMEREGVVGPSDGRGTREVLAPPPH